MILPLFASLLLLAAQDPSAYPQPDPAADATQDAYPTDATQDAADAQADALEAEADAVEAAAEAAGAAAEAAEQAAQAAADAAQQAEEPEEPVVCRRRSVYNEFGRQRSTRVCRPRSAWGPDSR
ncbi:MAG TPA: hypothetical protein VGX37_06790 [Allosphingosinicella sp.]|jgi:hypothetical protein|nr:hypothetical protein [Allosphingosinicella sp.]